MRTITIPIDLPTALQLIEPELVLVRLVVNEPGISITVEAMRVEEVTIPETADPPPAPAPKPVAKAAPAKKAAPKPAERLVCDCGQVFASPQGIGVHRARSAIHRAPSPSPVAAVPPPAPTPIRPPSVTGPPPTSPAPAAQPAPTKPSSMCDRGDHTMCKTAQARCNCTCHGRAGQQPPVSAAS